MSGIAGTSGNVSTVGASNSNANIAQRPANLLNSQAVVGDPWGGIKTETTSARPDEGLDPDLAAAINERKARSGNPPGAVTPVDSEDARQIGQESLSVVAPSRTRKPSDHRGNNAAPSPNARVDLNDLASAQAKRLIYQVVRSDIGCSSSSKTVDQCLQEMLDAFDRPDDHVLRATSRALLSIALERGQKSREALLREERAERAVDEWKECYKSLHRDFNERGVELGLLQAKVAAYEGRTGPAFNAASAPNCSHQSLQGKQIYGENSDEWDEVFNVKTTQNDPNGFGNRNFGLEQHSGPYRTPGNFVNYPNQVPSGIGNQRLPPNFVPNFDDASSIYLEDQKRIDVRVRTLKLEPKFTGRPKSRDPIKQDMAIFDRWYRKVQGQMAGASEGAKLAAIVNALEGDAYQLYATLSPEQSRNYKLVVARLSDHFKSRMTREQLRSELHTLHIEKNEEYQAYLYRTICLFNNRESEYGEPLSHEERKELLLNGLPLDLSERVKNVHGNKERREVPSFDDYILLVGPIVNEYFSRRREREPRFPSESTTHPPFRGKYATERTGAYTSENESEADSESESDAQGWRIAEEMLEDILSKEWEDKTLSREEWVKSTLAQCAKGKSQNCFICCKSGHIYKQCPVKPNESALELIQAFEEELRRIYNKKFRRYRNFRSYRDAKKSAALNSKPLNENPSNQEVNAVNYDSDVEANPIESILEDEVEQWHAEMARASCKGINTDHLFQTHRTSVAVAEIEDHQIQSFEWEEALEINRAEMQLPDLTNSLFLKQNGLPVHNKSRRAIELCWGDKIEEMSMKGRCATKNDESNTLIVAKEQRHVQIREVKSAEHRSRLMKRAQTPATAQVKPPSHMRSSGSATRAPRSSSRPARAQRSSESDVHAQQVDDSVVKSMPSSELQSIHQEASAESAHDCMEPQTSENTIMGEGSKKKYDLQPSDEGYSRRSAKRWNRMRKFQKAKKGQVHAQVDDAAAKSTHSLESQLTRPTASTEKVDEPMDMQSSEAPPAKRACSEVSVNPGSSASQRSEHAMQERFMQMQEFMMKNFAMLQQQSQQQAQETAMLKAMLAQIFPQSQAQPQVTQEHVALLFAQQQQQAALHAQQLQQQQLKQQLFQQQQFDAQQQQQEQLQAAITDHAFVNPTTAMQGSFIVTQNGPTDGTPPTQGVTVTYVRAPTSTPRPLGPNNLYLPLDNDQAQQ